MSYMVKTVHLQGQGQERMYTAELIGAATINKL